MDADDLKSFRALAQPQLGYVRELPELKLLYPNTFYSVTNLVNISATSNKSRTRRSTIDSGGAIGYTCERCNPNYDVFSTCAGMDDVDSAFCINAYKTMNCEGGVVVDSAAYPVIPIADKNMLVVWPQVPEEGRKGNNTIYAYQEVWRNSPGATPY
ncbi:MAG: hypothetical protein IT292_09605 [Deltaproteobacteria bacterium]|nr:hypothetical protein [Deltaproteobacteria bacterium]